MQMLIAERALQVAALVVLPLLFIANAFVLKKRLSSVWVAVAGAATTYALLLAAVAVLGARLQAELDSFDLNEDGTFSGIELTPEQQEAMRAVTSDTARTFAPITGAIYVLLYLALVSGVRYLLVHVFSRVRSDEPLSRPAVADREVRYQK